MSKIRFDVHPRADLGNTLEIVPAIDEVDLTDLIHAFERRAELETRASSYGGLIPAHYDFGPIDLHLLGAAKGGASGKVALLGCSCGEWGCWPLLARIVATPSSVTWSDFEQPFRKQRDYSAFGPFSFARGEYERALVDLRAALPSG